MTTWGYSRSSTAEQTGEGMIFRLTEAGVSPENIFVDHGISGMLKSRPEWDKLQALMQPGDVLVTPELSRIGRKAANVMEVIDKLEERHIGLRILDLGVDTTTPAGRMIAGVIACLARMERDYIAQRTRDALAAKKASGVKLGAPPKVTDKDRRQIRAMRDAGIPVPAIVAASELSRATVYRVLAETESPAAE